MCTFTPSNSPLATELNCAALGQLDKLLVLLRLLLLGTAEDAKVDARALAPIAREGAQHRTVARARSRVDLDHCAARAWARHDEAQPARREGHRRAAVLGAEERAAAGRASDGAASDDALYQRRSLPEIQERLRHANPKSTLRYKKHTRYLAELGQVPPLVRAYGEAVEAQATDILNGRLVLLPPPELAAAAR